MVWGCACCSFSVSYTGDFDVNELSSMWINHTIDLGSVFGNKYQLLSISEGIFNGDDVSFEVTPPPAEEKSGVEPVLSQIWTRALIMIGAVVVGVTAGTCLAVWLKRRKAVSQYEVFAEELDADDINHL